MVPGSLANGVSLLVKVSKHSSGGWVTRISHLDVLRNSLICRGVAPQEETVTVTVTSIPDYCQTLESVLESSATPIAPVPVTAFTPLPLGPEMSTSAPAEASTSSALSLPVSEVSSLGGSTTSNDISVAQVPPTSAGSSTTTDVVSTSSMTEMTTAQTLSTSQSVGVTPTAPPARNDADGGNHALAAVMSTLVALVSAGFVSWMLV
ncbi:MAG: hypothetical protein M1817_004325 [Caeruleum heppii]|nr:MAG: hypothetical protein M1817_004325 [Caeruleum heppii]